MAEDMAENMEEQFWLDKWANNQIGFHEDAIHPLLQTYWPKLTASEVLLSDATPQHVFVPLCGKSLDLLWLRDQGHHVFGIELSDIAVESFFAENEVAFKKTVDGTLYRYEAKQITVWCGDYFDLQPEMVPAISLFYDRAALIALKPETRERYMKHLGQLVTDTAQGLLITVEYDEGLVNPPPHSIPASAVAVVSKGSFHCEPFGVHAAEVKGKPCIEHALLMRSVKKLS